MLLLSLTPLLTLASFLLATFGFLTSWTYLRFYKAVFPDLDASQAPYSLRGDASETFAFAEFFPGPAKPLVAAISDQVFNVLVAMRLCTPFSAAEVSAAAGAGGASGGPGSYHGHRSGAPGSARAEAERRRALALKALDQRLHAATAGRGGPGSSPMVSIGAAGAARTSSSPTPPPPAATASTSNSAPPPPTTGPTVQTQPANSQTAMTSRPSDGMLGETSYNPEHDGGDKSEA